MRVRTYDENGALVEDVDDGTPPPEDVQQKFRDAVQAATTLDALKAALLGTTFAAGVYSE